MNIGIDIDNTITDTREMIFRYAEEYAHKTKRSVKRDLSHYVVEKSLGWTKQEAYDFLAACLPDIYRNVQPKEHALQVISELHQNHRIILITSRNERDEVITRVTLEWLLRQGLTYDKLIMNQTENMHHFSKLAACRENRIDVMIEDHHDLALEIAEYLPVLLFDYPYNAHVECQNITRVKDWLQVKAIIEAMAG